MLEAVIAIYYEYFMFYISQLFTVEFFVIFVLTDVFVCCRHYFFVDSVDS